MLLRGKVVFLSVVIVFLLGCGLYFFVSSRRARVISVISLYPRLSINTFQAAQLTNLTQKCVLQNSSFHLRDERRPLGIHEVRFVLTDRPQSWDIWAQNIPQTSPDVIEQVKSLGESVIGSTLTLSLALDPAYLATLTDQQASIEFSESVNRALLKYCRGESQTSPVTAREAFEYYAQQRQSYTPLITVHRQ